MLCQAGRAVASSWSEAAVSERKDVTEPLARRLERSGLTGELLDVLETAVRATGGEAVGEPVPAPPYLVVTSRGPLCRVTLAEGRRLVLVFELFDVERGPRRYRFRDPAPETCLQVELV